MGQSAEAGVAAPQPDWRYRELQSARRGRHKGQLIGTEKRPLQHLARFILIGVSLCPSLPRRDARGSCSNASLSAAIGPNKPRSQAEQGQSTLYLCFRRRRGCDGCLPAWRAHDPDPARPPLPRRRYLCSQQFLDFRIVETELGKNRSRVLAERRLSARRRRLASREPCQRERSDAVVFD
jgi:hypothetical protein